MNPKITVLGGVGSVGSTAVEALASSGIPSEIIIGDINIDKADELAEDLNDEKISAVKVDANKPESIKNAIEGSDVVLNCVGPFYEYGPKILRAVIDSGIDYVDICDDLDATEELLEMNERAEEADITALIGMGSSPGFANLLVKYCVEDLLDEVDSIDIYHAHGGEETEGPAVVKHRIHSMSIPIPVYDNSEFKRVDLFSEEGKAYEETVNFRDLGTYDVYLYPHPETITLPEHFEGVERVTNLGLVLPPEYANYIKSMVKLGLTDEEPINVQGKEIAPLNFAVASILSKREEFMKEAGIEGPRGCLRIDIGGRSEEGEERTYVFSMSSTSQGMGSGTGIPAAVGALLMGKGSVTGKGALPPEACVNPTDALDIAGEIMQTDQGEGLPVHAEVKDENGDTIRELDIGDLF